MIISGNLVNVCWTLDPKCRLSTAAWPRELARESNAPPHHPPPPPPPCPAGFGAQKRVTWARVCATFLIGVWRCLSTQRLKGKGAFDNTPLSVSGVLTRPPTISVSVYCTRFTVAYSILHSGFSGLDLCSWYDCVNLYNSECLYLHRSAEIGHGLKYRPFSIV